MSDGSILGNVAEGLKDLGKEAVKQVIGAPRDAAKAAVDQTVGGVQTAEVEAKKKAEEVFRMRRAQEITAEMEQIRKSQEENPRTGPEIPGTKPTTQEELVSAQTQPTQDVALRNAQTKIEGDSRANKG